MFNTSLESILGHFNKVHARLDRFIANKQEDIAFKNDLITDLQNQLADHHTELARALTIKDNVRKLLGL